MSHLMCIGLVHDLKQFWCQMAYHINILNLLIYILDITSNITPFILLYQKLYCGLSILFRNTIRFRYILSNFAKTIFCWSSRNRLKAYKVTNNPMENSKSLFRNIPNPKRHVNHYIDIKVVQVIILHLKHNWTSLKSSGFNVMTLRH